GGVGRRWGGRVRAPVRGGPGGAGGGRGCDGGGGERAAGRSCQARACTGGSETCARDADVGGFGRYAPRRVSRTGGRVTAAVGIVGVGDQARETAGYVLD